MDILRYINLKELSGAEISAEHELTLHTNLETPIITSYCAKKPTLTMTGDYPIDKYLHSDKISDDIEIARIYFERKGAGSLYIDKNIFFIHLHIKEKDLPNNIQNIFFASIAKVLKKYDIFVSRNPLKPKSNDLVVKQDELYKKIVGDWKYSYRKGWIVYGIAIFFKPNFEIMSQVYRMDTVKMKEKNIEKIEDAVIGAGENLDKNKVVRNIIDLIAERLNCDLITSEFTLEEKETMKKLIPLLSSKDWIYNAKR